MSRTILLYDRLRFRRWLRQNEASLSRQPVVLLASESVPSPPTSLDVDGLQLWDSVWTLGRGWLSEDVDYTAVELACHAADDLAIARRRSSTTGTRKDERATAAVTRSLHRSLAVLKLSPATYVDLGVPEASRRRVADLVEDARTALASHQLVRRLSRSTR